MGVSLLANAPTLSVRQALAMRAFVDLIGERAMAGEVMGPIYWRAIVMWCDRYAISDAEQFIELVQAIDRDYLQHEKPTRNSGKGNPISSARAQHH